VIALKMKAKKPAFPKLNQRQMAEFLGLRPERFEWASHVGIVDCDGDFYHPEIVTPQWLAYVREQSTKRSKNSEFEKQRVRLTRAKAEEVERRLSILDGSLLGTDDIVACVKTVCLRIKTKLQGALPRLTRACFHAPSLNDALLSARAEFDLLIAELSALDDVGTTQFEIVNNANGGSKGSAAAKSQTKRAD
jgi:hypothetical protein